MDGLSIPVASVQLNCPVQLNGSFLNCPQHKESWCLNPLRGAATLRKQTNKKNSQAALVTTFPTALPTALLRATPFPGEAAGVVSRDPAPPVGASSEAGQNQRRRQLAAPSACVDYRGAVGNRRLAMSVAVHPELLGSPAGERPSQLGGSDAT